LLVQAASQALILAQQGNRYVVLHVIRSFHQFAPKLRLRFFASIRRTMGGVISVRCSLNQSIA
jgi:hypothetical protein